MNTTSWNNYNSGDDLRSKLRASTAPVAGYPSHPMSLMPGQASRVTPRPNLTGTSRRMSIADDIRNAHNIPPPFPAPSVPLYSVPTGAAEFHPRLPPPLPSSTPPPPRPPLPASLTAAAFRALVPPPPIPPKPFVVPSSSQEDGRLLTVPRSLMPGGQLTQIVDQVTESIEPQVDESEIAMAIALSASVSEEEESQRQKLVLQEEDDIAKALEASMLEARNSYSHSDNVLASSSSDRPASSSHNHEASSVARLLAISSQTGSPSPADSGPAPSQSVFSSEHEVSAGTLASEQKSLTIEPRESTSPTNPELPVSLLHIEHGVSSPSPSTPSDLAYLLPVKEEEEGMTLREETTAEAHLPYPESNFSPMCLTQSPESITNALPPPPIPSGNLPEYSSRDETQRNLPSSSSSGTSTPILRYSNPTSVGEPSAASGSSGPPYTALSEPLPPSYTETPLPVAELAKQDTKYTTDPSSASTRNAAQSSAYTPPSRPSSATSTSPYIQHRLPSIASQVDLRTGSSIYHLSRNSSTNSSIDPDSSSSTSLHSGRSSANSTINVNAFVNKELFNGVSVGFMPPKISSQFIPMVEEMPPIISLPYGKARPLHLQGLSWRHLLKLMASLSGTRMEAALDVIAATKTTPKLRTVIQFIKPRQDSPVWRTVFYFTIDYPPPQPSVRHRSVNELPYSYSLAGIPTLLRDAADSPLSKTYTIPASDSVPYPTLPITFPNLALYMQAVLEESRRYLNDSHSDYRKLAKMITTCYPDEDVTPEPSERRGLFSRVIGRSSKPQKRGGNEDTYELVTPFVPDEWG